MLAGFMTCRRVASPLGLAVVELRLELGVQVALEVTCLNASPAPESLIDGFAQAYIYVGR